MTTGVTRGKFCFKLRDPSREEELVFVGTFKWAPSLACIRLLAAVVAQERLPLTRLSIEKACARTKLHTRTYLRVPFACVSVCRNPVNG